MRVDKGRSWMVLTQRLEFVRQLLLRLETMACRPCGHLKWFLRSIVPKACALWEDILFCALPLQASELADIALLGQKVSFDHPSAGSRADPLACDTSQLECDFKEPTCWSGCAPADVAHMPMITCVAGTSPRGGCGSPGLV
jgi:hypothetical protein